MGDDAARALGVTVDGNRLGALGFGAALCAVAVLCAGPITFVALAAPQIARRLTGSPTVQVIPSMAVGALLLLASDTARAEARAHRRAAGRDHDPRAGRRLPGVADRA